MEVPHQPSIASFYQQSITKFEGVCRLLGTSSNQNSHEKTFPLLSDELGRLRAWAGNCGAHRIPSSRVSLDHRLREASHIQKRVTELLVELTKNLEDVETLVSAPETNTFSVKHEHYADSDSDSSTNTSLKHCAIQDESVEELSTDIEYVASNITHIITCLNKLSMIIQSPAPRDRLHKSQTIPVAHLLPYEILHVQDKFPQVPDFLVERLARANVARRQMLKYYQHHQGGIVAPAGPEFSSDHHPVIDQTLPAAGSTRKSLEPLVICVDRKKEGTISTIPSSQTTISAYIAGLQELTSDPLSLAEVESEGGISQTSFESLSGGMGGSYVPDAPSLLNDAPFQCPYCFLIIRPKNRDSWLRHIFKDLQPYICTFEDCAMPERLFRTRQAWYTHEVKYHRKHWLCKMCNISFTEAQLLEEHLRTHHNTAPETAHVFVEHCEVPLETAQPCPLCDTTHYPVQLRSHLARHLQELSLFALQKVDLGEDPESGVSHSTQDLLQVDDGMDFQSPLGSTRNSNSTKNSEPNAINNEEEGDGDGDPKSHQDHVGSAYPPNIKGDLEPKFLKPGVGIVGLAGQLTKATMDCYKIFDNINDVGSTYDEILDELRTQGLRLRKWEQAWGFGDSNQEQRLQPGDYRYRYATASLARIVSIFCSVEKLQERYGIVVEKDSLSVGTGGEKQGARPEHRLLPPLLRSRRRGPSTSRTQTSTLGLTNDDLHVLENPQILADTHILPGLDDEIKSMTQVMNRVQQSLSVFLKLRWVISDNAKLEELLRNLTSLNNGLFQVLPAPEPLLAHSVNPPHRFQDSKLKLSFDIPFSLNIRNNRGFVGREYLLEKLKQEIEKGKDRLNIIVLYGTGGMGKTQLALKYVYQQYRNYSSVFFVNAASIQTTLLGFIQIMQRLVQHHGQISDDYAHIGQLLGMAGKLDPAGCFTVTSEPEEQHVVSAVKQWFSAPGNTNWLLVFDNLDDPDLVDIDKYVPSCNHGTVIITSRRRDCVRQGRRGLEVQRMHHMESIQLLLSACAIPKFEDLIPLEQTAASTIAQELGYLPLALSQAGAYLHLSQYSLGRYLKEYQTKAAYLLSQRWTVGQHDRSVFATWEVSFRAIQEKSPKAADLLLVCGFFDHEDIQRELLQRGLKLEKHDHTLEESIRILFSYCLLERGSSDNSFSIHPLVHCWARLRLKSEPQKEVEVAREAFEIITSGLIRSGEQSTVDWAFEQQAMPHINAVMNHMPPQYLALNMIKIPDEACTLGNVFNRHGRYKQAMEWYVRALAGREKALGIDHPHTLTTVNNMASVFDNQGQYEKALELYERALAGREKALGVDHPHTLTTVNNMASVFDNQGQYEKALELYERALAGREKALGVHHPDTLTTVNNMAYVFDNQGQYEKALGFYERALAGREKVLGVDHPDTLTTVNNMAYVFDNQGQYEKALEWYERALAGGEKTLGVDHPHTQNILRGLLNLRKRGANRTGPEPPGTLVSAEEPS